MFNVERAKDIPPSLLKRQGYGGQDVWDALSKMFYGKCYLCETHEPGDLNVEHLKSHRGDADLKFLWENLYFSCSRCNNVKLDKYDDILDCCEPNHNVFRAIKCLPPRMPYSGSLVIEAVMGDAKALKTAELLDRIFNSVHSPSKRIGAANLRHKVYEQCELLLQHVNNYFKGDSIEDERSLAIEKIRHLLRRDQPYSAFMRWIILEDEKLKPIFDGELD